MCPKCTRLELGPVLGTAAGRMDRDWSTAPPRRAWPWDSQPKTRYTRVPNKWSGRQLKGQLRPAPDGPNVTSPISRSARPHCWNPTVQCDSHVRRRAAGWSGGGGDNTSLRSGPFRRPLLRNADVHMSTPQPGCYIFFHVMLVPGNNNLAGLQRH